MKDKFSLFYKILIVVISGIGLILNFNLLTFKEAILYFTIQSNLLCFIIYLIIVILMLSKKLKKKNMYYIFKGMATMAITTTFLVYHFVIVPEGDIEAYVGHNIENAFVHVITPLLIIFDYFIFEQKGKLKKSYPFIWSLTLLAYGVFTIVYALSGGRFNGSPYPYPCMNVDNLGLFRVVINEVSLYVGFILISYIIIIFDAKEKRKNKNKKHR